MASFKDYYEILGVDKDAKKEEIRRAFRKMAAKHHPDRNLGDASAEERFKEINEAYTALSDPEKRKIYDTYGRDGQVPPDAWSGGGGPAGHGGSAGGQVWRNVGPEEFAGFSDFFQSLFGSGFGGVSGDVTMRGGDPFTDLRGGRTMRTSTAAKPRRFEGELQLDLQSAFQGGEVPITVDGRHVTVTVPAGVRHGAKLRLRGQAPGGGDLLLKISLRSSGGLTLDGEDVRAIARVPDHVAALGGKVQVPSLEGPIELSIPAGSSSGRQLRLRGQGWPRKGGGRGDELVELRVTVPEHLDDRQTALYRKLRDHAPETCQEDEDAAA
jgi:curved DNA-binding protein